MTDTPAPTPAAQPFGLFQSRTVLSALAAILTAYLPTILGALGVQSADQSQAVDLINQLGPLVFGLAAIFFRSRATQVVTHLIGAPKAGTMRALLPLAVICLAVSAPFLVACTLTGSGASAVVSPTQATEVEVAQGETSLELAYNVAAKAYLSGLPFLNPAVHSKVKGELQAAKKLVDAARAAEALDQPETVAQLTANALTLIAQAKTDLNVH